MSAINDALKKARRHYCQDQDEIPSRDHDGHLSGPARVGRVGPFASPRLIATGLASVLMVCLVFASVILLAQRRPQAVMARENDPASHHLHQAPQAHGDSPIAPTESGIRNPAHFPAPEPASKQPSRLVNQLNASVSIPPTDSRTGAPAPRSETKPSASGTSAVNVRLQGIFFSQNHPSAVINGRTVRAGEKVEGIQVLAITPTSVQLRLGNEIRVLKLH